jgi:hypothetical protein
MTETRRRPRLVPKAAIIAGVVIVAVLAAAGLTAYLVARSRLVDVPDLSGMTEPTADSVLREAGLSFERLGTRVSVDVPVGAVMSQTPVAGARVRRGTSVGVFLSAGPQAFVVPDLIGSPVSGAEEVLTALGFTVVLQPASSETTEAIVLEMYPAPGTSVSVGDEIRLTVPGPVAAEEALLPYDLQGLTVLLDPLPMPVPDVADAPTEVGRRLQALLEAAGANVTSTRSATGSVISEQERISIVSASSAVLYVSIQVSSGGSPGVTILHLPSGGNQQRAESSTAYARAITRAATLPALTINEPRASDDPVLKAFSGVPVSVVVGDTDSKDDVIRFGDPSWADQIARAVYRGIGTTYADR